MDQLYLDRCQRNFYISEVIKFSELYEKKIFPVFENIEQETEKITRKLFDESCEKVCSDAIDLSELAEEAEEEGISFYQTTALFRYQMLALGIAGLYHLWEQQIRGFLYREISHVRKINRQEFCIKFKEIKKELEEYRIKIKTFPSYTLLNEQRLITNAIKHGDGGAKRALSTINPKLLKNNQCFEFRLSSLLEETLNINHRLFSKYSDNLIKFWKWLPERANKH